MAAVEWGVVMCCVLCLRLRETRFHIGRAAGRRRQSGGRAMGGGWGLGGLPAFCVSIDSRYVEAPGTKKVAVAARSGREGGGGG
jgi:hypothetical protein